MTDVWRPSAPETGAVPVSSLFQVRYPELVRLADLLGADDPEDIAQEAFARLIGKQRTLRDQDAALAYVRSTVCNLVRNRRRHLRVVRLLPIVRQHTGAQLDHNSAALFENFPSHAMLLTE